MHFDVERFLIDHGIPYKTSGTNIAEGWIGVEHCPFCGDRRYHCGIHLSSAAYSCWVCGSKGWIYAYLMAEMGITKEQVRELARGYFDSAVVSPSRKRRVYGSQNRTLEFPKSFVPVDDTGLYYLRKRGYDSSIATRYNLKSVLLYDIQWNYRLIVPFYIDGVLVGWTGRAIVPELEPRYKNISNEEALVDMRSTLYNVDALEKKSVLVEGPFDVMRIGGPCAAVIGLEYTTSQILMIKEKGVEECTIVFDGEEKAIQRAYRLAKQLGSIGIAAYVIELDAGRDPGSLTDSEAYQIRQHAL